MESMSDVFNAKYAEFGRDLQASCPELTEQIQASLALSTEERRRQFKNQILPNCSPNRNPKDKPSAVLPGVSMPESVWEVLSLKTKKAIQEYLSVLSFTLLMDSESSSDASSSGWTTAWATKMMNDMKEKMDNIDFSELTDQFAKIFGGLGGGSGPGSGPFSGIPELPEKFLKGQIAKLAEEIVKEFKVEDFGIDPAMMEAAGNDPAKAFQLMMDVFMNNPRNLQTTVQKLGKKLQQKVQSGALRPQELVAEAEELMKTFSENPQFVELMESFRKAFGFEDKEMAQAAGRDNDNRLSIARDRLRKKLEAKKAAAAAKEAAAGKKH
jgi:hypothetical protein